MLRRLNALLVLAGIHLCVPFCPTRLNVADDPTRDTAFRGPVVGCGFKQMDFAELSVASHSLLRRWASNWVRLVFLILGSVVFSFKDRSSFRCCRGSGGLSLDFSSFDFDSTLGFPGEGPIFVLPVLVWFCLFGCSPSRFCSARCMLGCCWVLLCSAPVAAMPISPTTPGDIQRAHHRSGLSGLPEGRPVLARTGSLRSKYFSAFQVGPVRLVSILTICWRVTMRMSRRLTACLQDMAGSFSKRVGRITSLLKRLMNSLPESRLCDGWCSQLGNLGYTWKVEPSMHHIAMPAVVLLAISSTCFAWGWTRLAGCFALVWGGLLRPGKLTNATRGDLLLPDDVQSRMPSLFTGHKGAQDTFQQC